MQIKDKILEIVNQNSGGVKFLELMVGVMSEENVNEITTRVIEYAIDELEAEGKLGVLRYAWDMGEVQREKMFIYTPLK